MFLQTPALQWSHLDCLRPRALGWLLGASDGLQIQHFECLIDGIMSLHPLLYGQTSYSSFCCLSAGNWVTPEQGGFCIWVSSYRTVRGR